MHDELYMNQHSQTLHENQEAPCMHACTTALTNIYGSKILFLGGYKRKKKKEKKNYMNRGHGMACRIISSVKIDLISSFGDY